MDPRPFKLDKNEFYIACHLPSKLPNGSYSGLIGVYELLRPQKHNMLTNRDWSDKPEIIDTKATNGYNSLEINGQPVDYDKVLQALCISRLRVNKLGYCYFWLGEGVADTMGTYGFTFYRMNDMWNWSNHGITVDLTSDRFAHMKWDRHDILYGESLFPDSKESESDAEKEILRLKDQVRQLEAELQSCKSKIKENTNKKSDVGQLVKRSVASSLFEFKGRPGEGLAKRLWQNNWDHKAFNRHLTPSNRPLTNGQIAAAYKGLAFKTVNGVVFDTSNWYYIGVNELSDPILIYEGSKCTVEIAGHNVQAPMSGTDRLEYYNEHVEQPPFVFGLTILAGLGPRLAIKLLY